MKGEGLGGAGLIRCMAQHEPQKPPIWSIIFNTRIHHIAALLGRFIAAGDDGDGSDCAISSVSHMDKRFKERWSVRVLA